MRVKVLIGCCFLLLLGSLRMSAADLVRVPLRNSRPDVMTVYTEFTLRAAAERRVIYRTLPSAMQSDLWVVHLEQFLAAHPELTAEQRSVVFEGLGIIAAGVVDSNDRTGPLYAAVQHLELRSRSIMSMELLKEAFVDLGGPDLDSRAMGIGGVTDRHFTARRTPIRTLDTVDCSCATDDDWCGSITSVSKCHGLQDCTFTTGCGWFFLSACNGLCL
jgi:hypothetical protein